MEPRDPILLIAQTCFPHLLTLDDLLAARCVCKAWRQSLSTSFCTTWRLPHSLWHTAGDNKHFNATIADAAAACQHAPCLVLESGGNRPSLPADCWPGLLSDLQPWLDNGSGSSSGNDVGSTPPQGTNSKGSSSNSKSIGKITRAKARSSNRHLRLQLRNPPSPQQLLALQGLPWLHTLRSHHSHAAVYSRHLASIAQLTQLQQLELLMEMPKLELRNLAHQRLRRVPLKGDCLSSLVALERLDVSCKAYTGDLLPDTLMTFSSPQVLAALSSLTHLGLSELALAGPWSVEEWLRCLTALKSLQLVLQDDPATCATRGVAAGSSSTCSGGGGAAGTAAGGAGAAGGASTAGLLGTGGLSAALAAAAQAAGSSRADQQLAVAQQNLLAGLQNLSSALQQAASSGAFGRTSAAGGSTATLATAASGGGHHHHHQHHATPHQLSPAGPSANSSAGGGGGGGHLARTSSSTSTAEPDTPSASEAAAAAMLGTSAAPASSRPLLPISLNACCPRLTQLVLANLYGERFIKSSIPAGLTRLVLHLANPSPGPINGEQLSAVVLQASDSLLSLELGLGMRFSLSGAVMRGLKRSLKQLQDLTLIEGAQDHLEGLGCWCNLPRLTLVEGRCTVPLRGLYELSMRAAMGRTPGVLRYHGHARHVEELGSRLGAALQELRLESLAGLGTGYRSGGGGAGAAAGSGSSSAAGSPTTANGSNKKQAGQDGGGAADGSDDDTDSVTGAEAAPLPALAHLSSMTRLEVLGEQIGQLDAYGVLVLSSCKQLRVLAIQGTEPWLSPDLGVKEQLEWLGELPQLRQLRLSGVMLQRSRLAAGSGGKQQGGASLASSSPSGGSSKAGGKKGGVTTADAAGGASSSSSSGGATVVSGGGSAASTTVTAVVPAVKGLGNGLGCVPPAQAGSKGGAAGAAAATTTATSSASHSPPATPAQGAPPAPTVTLTAEQALAAAAAITSVGGNAGKKGSSSSAAESGGMCEFERAFSKLTAAAAKLQSAAVAAGHTLPSAAAGPSAIAAAQQQLKKVQQTHQQQQLQLTAGGGAGNSGGSGGGGAGELGGRVSKLPSKELAQEAAEQEAAVAVCLEELRRWLCEMLPHCRVWLD